MAYKNKNDNTQLLKSQLKSMDLKNVYSFYGKEEFLKQYYISLVTTAVTGDADRQLSVTQFDENTFEIDSFIDEAANMSFSAENKLIVLRNIDLDTLPPTDKKIVVQTLEDVESTVYVLLIYDAMFLQDADYDKIRKRTRMIETQSKFSFVVEFDAQSDSALLPWISKQFSSQGVKISSDCVSYLLKVCGSDMTNLKNEITKLTMSAKDGFVDRQMIDTIVSRSLEVNVFNIAKDVIKENAKSALKTLDDCRIAKQKPTTILYNMETTFYELTLARAAYDKGVTSVDTIATEFGIAQNRKWLFKDYMMLCRDKDIHLFSQIMNETAKTEEMMKGSGNDQWQCLEMLIMKILRMVRKEN